MVERRKLERFLLQAPAILTVAQGEQEQREVELKTRDISAEGAYLLAGSRLAPGTPVKLEVLLTVDRLHEVVGETDLVTVKVEGTVIRAELGGMAVAFNNTYEIRTYGQDHPFAATR